ncbi:hypothetical protein LX64_02593 [Chitinophaga skermanii]|uniref:Uncharacterized protein n=1 Tax=Chitinophaga skermanii TaxID=331697 RepID=A0A327QNG8_9BACT|nr:hypothetical protein [Chitinophaga skermanii]RAJ05435.1 hypothetical protein LX64_02593 [Chitinophaga skermanii]
MKNKILHFITTILCFSPFFVHAQQPGSPLDGLPLYLLSVEKTSTQPGIPLQSFCVGKIGNDLLLVGGRTNGFHGTDPENPGFQFPVKYNNKQFYVLDMSTMRKYTATLPSAYMDQLSSTNMQACQSGNALYLCGGYGQNSSGSYVTYSSLVVIYLQEMIAAIKRYDTLNLQRYMGQASSSNFMVTGGELTNIGSSYFLVMGQRYTGPYQLNAAGQKYTNSIVQLNLSNGGVGTNPTASVVRSINGGDQFHRRDLCVQPIIDNGTPAIGVFGGVFTPVTNLPFLNPVYITQATNGSVKASINQSFKQKTNQYDCARVSIYDPNSGAMSVNLIGGISLYAYKNYDNPNDTLQIDFQVPFVRNITTILKARNGRMFELVTFPQNCMPTFLGAEAKFIPLDQYIYRGDSRGILDYSRIPNDPNGTIIGYMIGGIKAEIPNTNIMHPSVTNSDIYAVRLKRSVNLSEVNMISVSDEEGGTKVKAADEKVKSQYEKEK